MKTLTGLVLNEFLAPFCILDCYCQQLVENKAKL